MKTKFYYYQDPGHGWAAVPVSLLEKLNIAGEISTYSYQRGKTAYLEEDRDLGIFFNAYRDIFGADPVLISRHCDGRSPVRSYDNYHRPVRNINTRLIMQVAADLGLLSVINVGNSQEAAK